MPARKAGKNGSTRSGECSWRAVAEAIEARRGAAEIDDDEEERRERVDAETRADPGQAERQDERLAIGAAEEIDKREDQHRRADRQRSAVDKRPREGSPRHKTAGDGKTEQGGVARQKQRLRAHPGAPQSRRTKPLLTACPP